MEAGAVHEILAVVLDADMDASTLVGVPGVVVGVMLLEDEEAVPVPAALVAATVKVYEVPAVKPVKVIVEALESVVCVVVAGEETTE